jgi:hypothetical protein
VDNEGDFLFFSNIYQIPQINFHGQMAAAGEFVFLTNNFGMYKKTNKYVKVFPKNPLRWYNVISWYKFGKRPATLVGG